MGKHQVRLSQTVQMTTWLTINVCSMFPVTPGFPAHAVCLLFLSEAGFCAGRKETVPEVVPLACLPMHPVLWFSHRC